MKVYQTNQIKNISLLGSSGSGKTTLAEAMLYEGGVISRRGDVNSKNTVSDYNRVEHEYGYSVFSSVLFTEWLEKKLNIIDCPGSDDFINGAITSLNVTDTALMVINSTQGVEVGTQNLFRYTDNYNKPVIFVVNQLDHEKANYESTVESLHESFGKKAIIVQYPVNIGPGYDAMVDVLKMKYYKWGPDGGKPEISEIPDSEKEKAEELHNALVEAAAENDENLMELFFDQGTLNEDEMRQGMKKGMIARDLFPIFCVSAAKDMGVRRLMEFLGNIVPFVDEMPKALTTSGAEVTPDVNGPASIFVFKTSIEPHLGEVSYFKVMSGKITEGMDLINVNREAKERLSQLYCVAGSTRQKVSELVAGDIGATVKLKETKTNHTLNIKGCDYIFEPIKYPEPKYRVAIKPANDGDEEKLGEILSRIHEEDPTITVEYSKELKQIIVYGQGEFHLSTMKWRIENNDKLPIEFKNPKIPYRETITKQARADYRHKKQSGGAGQFGEVHMIIEPYDENAPVPTMYKFNGQEFKVNVRDTDEIKLPWGGKLVFHNCIVGGSIDSRFMPAILKGLMEKMEEGPLTGSYARDIRVCVYDGKMHPVDSNEISFKLAGRNAFRTAFKEAAPKILEPVYDVEVRVPADRMGDVMSDLQGRRATIEGMSSEKGFEVIKAKVPLKEMNKYSTSLSSITGGRAFYTMKFAKYDKVPPEVQEQLLAAYEAEQGED
ncbi:elongation factor G [Alkalitalea saponilacus]|uniref:Elongation factor G n=1 Tax=Alkalitalea saponilacus TaxID=889453 RepID=A0A1T5HTH8_9BACT|nr:elongation factor G [Alkalitalea saponilacus]ASB48540.1 elongation factor G [Alkalitalea saponilacus]SKC23831.1 elongation factor G [Alkalitalea saponilacus]